MGNTPEQWRKEAPPSNKQAVFKLFVGYAPGVGKTYNMLSEAIRRHSRGEDVVIGVIETHGRKPIAELARQLEIVPRRKLEYKGTLCEEMDAEARGRSDFDSVVSGLTQSGRSASRVALRVLISDSLGSFWMIGSIIHPSPNGTSRVSEMARHSTYTPPFRSSKRQ